MFIVSIRRCNQLSIEISILIIDFIINLNPIFTEPPLPASAGRDLRRRGARADPVAERPERRLRDLVRWGEGRVGGRCRVSQRFAGHLSHYKCVRECGMHL